MFRYGATGARGELPLGPYGPAIIGAGNPNPSSTMGIYKQPAGTQPYPKPASYGPQPDNSYSQGGSLYGKSNPLQGEYRTEPSMYQPNQYQTNPSNMYQPNLPNLYQPNQPDMYQPNQPNMYQPNQPNMYQPDMYQPNQPNMYQPDLYQPNMYQPNQPNIYQPNQPNLYQPNQPNMYQPDLYQPDLYQPNMYQPNQPNMYQPNQPILNQNQGNWRLDQGMQQQFQGNPGMNFGPPYQTMMQGSQTQFGQVGQSDNRGPQQQQSDNRGPQQQQSDYRGPPQQQLQQQWQSPKSNPGTGSNVVQTRKKRSAEKMSAHRNARKDKHPAKKTDSTSNSSKLTSPQRRIRQRKTGYRAS